MGGHPQASIGERHTVTHSSDLFAQVTEAAKNEFFILQGKRKKVCLMNAENFEFEERHVVEDQGIGLRLK
jgi:hypothetical protein